MFIYHPGKQAELFNYKDQGCELELELEKVWAENSNSYSNS